MTCPYCGSEDEPRMLWRDTGDNERLYVCGNDYCAKEFLTNEQKEVIETYGD